MSNAQAHTCHAWGCKAPCPPRWLMCGPCWSFVPHDVQAEVYRTVKLRGPRVDASWAPWWQAQADACKAVAVASGRSLDMIEVKYAHEVAFVRKLLNMGVKPEGRVDG